MAFFKLGRELSLVLELSEDGSLDQWIYKKKKTSPDSVGHVDKVLHWFYQCASGLNYLHSLQRPIIHRDINPQNFLLFDNGRTVKLGGMGLADDSMTGSTGTLQYTSPEVISKPHYDTKADVWSFGVSCFEVLTCKKPYHNNKDMTGNMFLFMKRVMDGLRPGPIPAEPSELVELIQQCWHADPERRPTMKQVCEKITNIKSFLPETEILEPIGEQSKPVQNQNMPEMTENSYKTTQESLSKDDIKSKDIEKTGKLGNGAFAVVYSGKWKSKTGVMRVALKCMSKKDISLDSKVVKREMHLRFLEHPNIIKYYGVCLIEESITLVLELSPDGALDEWIFTKKNSSVSDASHVDKVFKWFTQCAKGLDYLHSRPNPIIHRDIKPGNMLLFDDGETLKITDMGLSREISEESMTGTTGTLKYMSPEAMKTGQYDSKADVFSFGISLFAILTCEKPYDKTLGKITNEYIFINKVDKGARPGPLPEQPPGLRKLMESCWHQDPKKRPTMIEVTEIINFIQRFVM